VTEKPEIADLTNGAPDPFRDWDAAYVLGSLSPDDRRAYERHLSTCPACSVAMAELAGLPGILAKLSPEEAVSLLSEPDDSHLREEQHQPGLVRRLAVAANARRRRMRGLAIGLAAGAAAVLAIGGILVGSTLAPVDDQAGVGPISTATSPSAAVLAMAPVGPATMTAQLQLTEKGWGTRFDWSCKYLGTEWDASGGAPEKAPAYSMVVTDAAGTETTVATWSATGSEASNLVASSSVPTADIRSVEIRWAGTTTALVRTEI
jgi:hypothetical protein